MLSLLNIFWLAVAVFSTSRTVYAASCECYTETSTVTNPVCPPFTSHCITPECVRLVTKTIPPPVAQCKRTPTVTTLAPCQTACPQGCGTFTTTLKACPTSTVSVQTSCTPRVCPELCIVPTTTTTTVTRSCGCPVTKTTTTKVPCTNPCSRCGGPTTITTTVGR